MANEDARPTTTEDGFEYEGRFYRWHVTDMGKDLMLIDRFSGMSIVDFFEVVDDDHERGRGPILLTLIATSIRNGHPGWSVERIIRTVMDMSLSDVEFIGEDEPDRDEAMLPPSTEDPAPPGEPPTNDNSRSQHNGSLSLSTPPADSTSETSSVIPA